MRLLLDTHAFIWWVTADSALSSRARNLIAAPDNECLLSAASAWEMSIKASIGKLQLDAPLERFIPEQVAANGFIVLPVGLAHAVRVAGLPWHHRDPFDRILAAQALEEGVAIVSRDRVFKEYGVKFVW